MTFIDFPSIVREAWLAYDNSRIIKDIQDISAKVSTNHVYRVTLHNDDFIIAKLAYFGKYEHFVEDHTIINVLANNLPRPFENFLAHSLMKGNSLFTYRYQSKKIDVWVVFYRPISIIDRPPKILEEDQIIALAKQFALFHKTCHNIRNTLPSSTKTMQSDIFELKMRLEANYGKSQFGIRRDEILHHCNLFLNNMILLDTSRLSRIPVFIDWNIGNFSVDERFNFYSRWDYDWFRMSYRVLDFYFISRVVSDIGDKTVFSYLIDPLLGERFKLFLKTYHQIFPLTREEIKMLKEVYRFFILNYVIKDGSYFFHDIFAHRLQKEAFDIYLPSIEKGLYTEELSDVLF